YLPSLADHRLEFPSCATAAPDSPESVICSAASSSELWLGWSLANLGDVDLDGYADFAIGAPLTRGGGAVLIYRGAADGRPRHSQTLINTVANGFGESLSKGADFDGSGYPDLMIGAPRHGPGAVYFYPARYVVRLAIGEGGVDPGLPLDGTSPPEKPTYSVDLQFFIDTAVSPNGNGRFAAQGLGPNNTLRLSSGTPQLYTLNLVYTAGVSLESDTDSPLLIEAAWWNRSPKPRSDGVRPLDSRVTLRSAPLIRGIGSQEGTRFRLSEMKWNHGCRESWCQTTVTLDCESNITRQADTGSLEILVDSRATPVEVKCRIAVSDEPAYGAYLLVSYNSEAFSLTSSLEKSTSSEFRPDGRGVEARLLFKRSLWGLTWPRSALTFPRSRISPTGSRTRASLSAGVRTAVSVTLESLFTESTVYYNQRSVGFNAFDGSAYKLSRQFPRLSVTLSSQAGAYLPVSYLVLHWPLETRPEPGEQHGKYLTYWQTLPYIAVRGSKSNNATAATEVTCDADQVAGVLNPLQLKPDSVDAFAAAGAAEAATASPRTAGSAATRIVPVSLATGIAASAGQTPGPLTDEGQPDS
uniref:Integrin_alpha2 domain-containing protein n=1 Tax=Macrostomum lignano TaxID=282301 RepID=A0A1I8HQ63_9PLAT